MMSRARALALLPHARHPRDARVGDDHVEPAPELARLRRGARSVLLVADVPHHVARLAPGVGDLADGLGEGALVASRHEHARLAARELEGDRAPDALSATGDDGDLTFEQVVGRRGRPCPRLVAH